MTRRPEKVPALYVEGVDDISTVAALLKRHGIDTKQGLEHLWIKSFGSDQELLSAMADTIKTERSTPCGFILDIDIDLKDRWQAVCNRLQFKGDSTTRLVVSPEAICPSNGYIGQVEGYRKPFGVWLMPDCKSDKQKLEHLIASLIPNNDVLYNHAQTSAAEAKRLIDEANQKLPAGEIPLKCFSDVDRIKANIRTWLAWQQEPGLAFGAAINDHVLGHDSQQATALLDWMKQLYGFNYT